MEKTDEHMPFCCPPSAPSAEQDVSADDSPVVTETIGKASDVKDGEKKMFVVRDRKILVINDKGTYYAVNGLCPHYAFPLDKGLYSNGRIRCSLHGSCYDVKTGDIEDYPTFGGLNTFQIKDINGDLVISTTEKCLSSDKRESKPKITKSNDLPIVVIGGGPSAGSFIEHARLNGCSAPITMISMESLPPYDRTRLSKNPSSTTSDLNLRTDDYYKEMNVNALLKTTVDSVDTRRRVVTLASGDTIQYSKLVIATGGTLNKLSCPGSDLQNLYYLRVLEQANEIADKVKGKRVVVIGAAFIGMEVASAISETATSVTVISNSEEPLPPLGADVGRAIRKRFEAQGVKFVCNGNVVKLEGSSSVEGVRLEDGQLIDADVVIAGIGVSPTTSFLKGSPINLDDAGFIVVDEMFRTSADFVYAIGDAVTFPLPLWEVESTNIQHFQTAQTHGQRLGYSIVGKPYPRPIVPFFWTLFFKKWGVKLAGYSKEHTDTLIHGNLDEFNFIKYFFKNDVLVAVANGGSRSVHPVFLELFSRGWKITRKEVEENINDVWEPLLDDK